MRLAKGPRPWPVRVFAAAFLMAAIIRLSVDLQTPWRTVFDLSARFPALDITRDHAIIILCAQFTIACIPIALIWFLASRFARWMIVAMVLVRLIGLPQLIDQMQNGDAQAAVWRIWALVISFLAARLLFTEGAAYWIKFKGRGQVEAFE